MKVVTWNLGYGSRGTPGYFSSAKQDQAWYYLCNTIKPDVALLQEVKPPTWVPSQALVFEKYWQGWGTAIYAPLLPLSRDHFLTCPGRVAAAFISLNDLPLLFVSIHALTNTVFPRLNYVFDELELELTQYADRAVVGGDFNSARLAADKYPGCGDGPFWEKIDKGDLWIDCYYRLFNTEARTYFKDGAPPFQDDHLLVSGGFLEGIKLCSPLDNKITRSLSDHIPVIAELAF